MDIGIYLRRLCEYKEANACADHIHMLVKIPNSLKYQNLKKLLIGGLK